jgi:hypothetical protein
MIRGCFVATDERRKPGWRERHREAKRAKAERTGDSHEKRAERKSSDPDVKDAASGTAVRGTLGGAPGVGGGGGGF